MKLTALALSATCLAAATALAAGPCGSPTITVRTYSSGASSLPKGADKKTAAGEHAGDHSAADEAMQEVQAAMRQASDELQKAFTSSAPNAAPATSATAARAAGPQPWIGVSVEELGDDVRALLPDEIAGGLVVRHVDADSPASQAGVQENDILLKLDDQLLVTPDQLRRLIQLRKEGGKLSLSALRKGKPLTYEVSPAMKEIEDADPAVFVFGGSPGGMRIELPADIQKMLAGGMPTVFSTSIVLRGGSAGSYSSPGGGGTSRGFSGGGDLSVDTVNGQTTITYKGEEVFSGPTSGRITTKSENINGEEHAAAYDGEKLLWESKTTAAPGPKKK